MPDKLTFRRVVAEDGAAAATLLLLDVAEKM
jgi:hypothetical protein